ncbi:histidine kinase [Aliarcobacter butzleri 7h1h]|uniref:sensor histidine kinase n=1 Tax=Aliarcobacter butzleri TaxID=28197 RepID=UPI0002FBEB52|nr:sensor histidine kinase [Aliarcobacter butzleri]AGR77628.1 histidine kinase [Aliarcobacter butzleri 7h1h]MCG3696806.1 ATP-binding protein [Aliarcobacter butzleri]
MENTKSFRPKAHILRLLGNELIKNPTMAIYELIKNSYDADSTYVDVVFNSIDNIEYGSIIIEDDGVGLTSEVLESVWLEPGTDHRKPIGKDGNRVINRSPIYNRVPMGEKGVGRFAVHKLGDHIELKTRPKELIFNEENELVEERILDYELTLKIDWNTFSQKQYLEDILITWEKETNHAKFYFNNSSGTKIKVFGLKEPWSKKMAKDLKRNTLAMLSPKNNNTFKINLDFKNKWLEDFKDVKEILNLAPYKFNALLDEDFNLIINYEFNLSLDEDFGNRVIEEEKYNIQGLLIPEIRSELKEEDFTEKEIDEKIESFLETKNPFGNLFLEIYSFDLDSDTLKKYTTDAQALKIILKNHSGIKVFKDEMRVYDYGEPGNDWLKLDIRRIQNKDWFSNNQNIGYIYLDAEQSISLIEKTSREGFIDNDTFKIFYKCIIQILTDFKAERLKDRNKWLNYLKSGSKGYNPKPNPYNLFQDLIDNTDFSEEEQRNKLKKEAEKLQQDYEEKKETMLIPAGVGMTASVALHEIEKVIPQMKEVVESEPFKKDLAVEKIEELKDYLEGILSVLRKGGNKPINLKEVLEKAISNYKFKLKNRSINIEKDFDNSIDTIKCDKRYFITMVMNIIDNCIYWLDTIYKKEKYILIKTLKENDGSVSIIIADNGPGFKDEIQDLVRPFFSRKEDGIGIGLYLVDTIMMKYGKLMILEKDNEYDLPDKYTGAILKISFKKDQ